MSEKTITDEQARDLAKQWGPTRGQDDLSGAEREDLFAWVRSRTSRAKLEDRLFVAGFMGKELGLSLDTSLALCKAAGWKP